MNSKCRPQSICKIGTWTVEGLPESRPEKLLQVLDHMKSHGIAVLCVQEIHRRGSDYFEVNGFLVIFSGNDRGEREYAGVGFIVAPWVKAAVMSFTQRSSRLASIKFKISGGSLILVSAYAPHGQHEFDVRQEFFIEARQFVSEQKCHGPIMMMGDMNSRMHVQLQGEENIVGEHAFGSPYPTFHRRGQQRVTT